MASKKKLQVFVSSTYTDLKDERQAAVSAILKAGHIPAGMELFTAGDKSQMATIEKWIDESDVYMLILGGRYGSVEKTTNLSYTELEYDYAKQQGKAMFAVVIKEEALAEKVKRDGVNAMERDSPKELKLFREKVLSNISSFFSDEKDIKLCVHESLADLADNESLKGWVSADAVEDSKALNDEIRRLREENLALKNDLEVFSREKPKKTEDSRNESRFEEIEKILDAIEIKVPAEVTDVKKEFKTSLLKLFRSNQEALITGVTNSSAVGPGESFYYHNICPKLQVHGLVANEKIAGVRYRRSYVSRLGEEFLSYLDKKALLAKAMKSSPEVSVEN